MRVIIQQREHKYLELTQQLKSSISQLSTLLPNLPSTWFNTLKYHTKKDEDTLIQMKLGKIRRDLDDFNLGRAFSWKKGHRVPNRNITSHLLPPPMPLMQCNVGPSGSRPWPPSRPTLLSYPVDSTDCNHRAISHPSQSWSRPLTPKPQRDPTNRVKYNVNKNNINNNKNREKDTKTNRLPTTSSKPT